VLEGDLVGVLVGPELDGLHLRQLEQEQDRLLQPGVHHHRAVGRQLRDPCRSGVEQGDGPVDHGPGVEVVGIELGAPLPEVGDLGLEVGHGRQP